MEIHPPHKPIHSPKDFLLQLVTITAGVLIALSLEGVREWFHHRALASEALANLREEMTENKRKLDRGRERVKEERADLQSALQWATELLMTKDTSIRKVNLGTTTPELSDASWRTAHTTGALGHMKYEQVRTYASVYELQEIYTRGRLQKLERLSAAIGLFGTNLDPDKSPPGDLQNMREHLVYMLGNLEMEDQLARDLSKGYESMLKE